jgi:hypothetical protein
MATKQKFNWDKAKQRLLIIVKSDLQEEAKKKKIEVLLKTFPFGINLTNYEFRYDPCGYPYWATHQKNQTDSFKLREILDQRFDPDTFETDYLCPSCKRLV